MSKKFTSFLVLMAAVLLSLPAQAQKQLTLNKELKTGVVKKEVSSRITPPTSLDLKSNLDLDKLQKLGGKKVTGMRRADADTNTSIEGVWTFFLGDYYFQDSAGETLYVDFEATLEGNEVWFEDPTGYELPFVAEYNEAIGTLTFNRLYLGQASGYYVYQDPFVYNYETSARDAQSIVGIYSASAGTITFEPDNGISWPAYNNASGIGSSAGYFGIYDLEGAIYVGEAEEPEPIDEEQAGQWTTVGMATFVDAWILPSYSMGGVQLNPNDYPYEVELQQNVENENLYRLWKPYKTSGALVYDQGLNQSTYDGQIVFDISDPDHVEVVANGMPAGFKNGNGEFYLNNELGWLIKNYPSYDKETLISMLYGDEPADTYKDGVVTITSPTFDFSAANSDGYSWQNNPYYSIITFPPVTGTIAESGYSTLASAYGLDFANAKGLTAAYAVTEITEYAVVLESVNEVPANTGVILQGTPGATYTIPVKAGAAKPVNLLEAAVKATAIGANEAYILQDGEFHLVTAASEVPAGKAYLPAVNVPSEARTLSFLFGGETTGVAEMKKAGAEKAAVFYNLNGQRVSSPANGLYIVNGKKVIIK